MKILNKKGFTLIELLAVIVVLSIILVITVPTVLNTLEGTREDALQASATSSAKYYHQQLQMILLGTRPDNFLVDAEVNYSTDTVNAKAERCISVEEADILGLNKDDYSINEGCKVEGNILSNACNTITNHSTVRWTSDGNVTVKLVGKIGGKFVKGNTPLVAVSSSIGNNTNLTTFGPIENVILTNTKNGSEIRNLKLYGNTVDGNSVGELDSVTNQYKIPVKVSGKNIIESYGFSAYNMANPSSAKTLSNNYGTTISTTKFENSITVTQTNTSGANISSYINGYFTMGLNNVEGDYILSFDIDIKSNPLNATYMQILNQGGVSTVISQTVYLPTESKGRVSINLKYRYTTTEEYSTRRYLEFRCMGMSFTMSNIMLTELEKTIDYEPYQEPETYEITLSAPLRSNGEKKDYIDFEVGKVVRWVASDGSVLSTPTEEAVTLPQIKTLNGTTILSTDTTVKPLFEGKY